MGDRLTGGVKVTSPAGATDDWNVVNLMTNHDPSEPTPADVGEGSTGGYYYWWFDAGAGPVTFTLDISDNTDNPLIDYQMLCWTGPDADHITDVTPDDFDTVHGTADQPHSLTTTATEGQRYLIGVGLVAADAGHATLVLTADGADLQPGGGGGGEGFQFGGTTVRVTPPALPVVKAANPITLIEDVAVPPNALRLKAPSAAPAIVNVPASNQLVVPQLGPHGPDGPEGPAGPSGPIGPVGDLDESIPDLSLIFENGLV